MKVAKERLERDLERLQTKEDSSDSLRRRLRETEVPSPPPPPRARTHARSLSVFPPRSVFYGVCFTVTCQTSLRSC